MGVVRVTQLDGKLPNLALMKLAAHHRTRSRLPLIGRRLWMDRRCPINRCRRPPETPKSPPTPEGSRAGNTTATCLAGEPSPTTFWFPARSPVWASAWIWSSRNRANRHSDWMGVRT